MNDDPHPKTRREARLEALKQLSEERATELAAAQARINELSKVGAELGAWTLVLLSCPSPSSHVSFIPPLIHTPSAVEARKGALEAAAAAAAATSLSTHAQLLQATKAQAEQVQGALPDLGRWLAACEAREEANARAGEEGRQAVERAQAMLTEHRSEGARLLAHVKKIEVQLAATAAAKRELEGEVAGLKARVASLEEGVRQRDASVHDLKTQNRELSGELEKVCRSRVWSEQ